MQFNEFPYRRIDIEQTKQQFNDLNSQLKQVDNSEDALKIIQDIQQLQATIDTNETLVSIRHSLDTEDSFYEAETAFWDEYRPIIEEWMNDYYRIVLDLPFREALEEELSTTFFKLIELQLQVFSPEIIPQLQRENQLITKYNQLIASAKIEFQGEIYNLPSMTPFIESQDRSVRKAAQEAMTEFFRDHLDDFDQIYDEMVQVRDKMARTLGFNNYTEMGYARMSRLDYNRQDVEGYREAVLEHIVPLVQEMYDAQAKRLDLDTLYYYDLPVSFKTGNAKPMGDAEQLTQIASHMYHEMSPETAEFFEFMTGHHLMDLEAKPGKQSGGYCTYLPDFKSPFIFANFNGTSGDVDVLTHEVGHAFQIYQSRWITTPEVIWPTYETCEIHSMSMEFFAWPWMDQFFGDASEKYKYDHLSEAVKFLPYGVLVDHFQHEVYDHPEWTPEERRQTWRRLEKTYLSWKDYADNELLESGVYWFRQGHIFSSPFYYIDYTLAQICALQFFQKINSGAINEAWADYLRICRLGGTETFLSVVEKANLTSPFEPNILATISETVKNYLQSVDTSAFQ